MQQGKAVPRYTQAHFAGFQLQQEVNYALLKTQVFHNFLREYQHFRSSVPIGCLTDLCSEPAKTKQDFSMFCGSGGYLYLYFRVYEFVASLSEEELAFYMEKSLNVSDPLKQQMPDHEINIFFNLQSHLALAKSQLASIEAAASMQQDRDVSFCFSHCSSYLIGAQIAHIQQDHAKFISYVERILKYKDLMVKKPEKFEFELLYGVPGYLYMILVLQKQFSADHTPPEYKVDFRDAIYQLAMLIMQQGLDKQQFFQLLAMNELPKLQLNYIFGKKNYLGGAHGVLGVIQVLLTAYELCQGYFDQPERRQLTNIMLKAIRDTLDYIVNLFLEKRNLPSSIQSMGNIRLYQFCHGITGAFAPLIKASRLFQIPLYIEVCMQMAEEMWKFGMLRKGYGLCHGIPGNAYTFMQLSQVRPESKLIQYAHTFLLYKQNPRVLADVQSFEFEDRYKVGISDNPFSLMLGSVGDMCAMLDFLKYKGMPAYEV